MIPLITEETVHRHKWIGEKDILDVIAIAESTPGPIAVNAATFVGYRIGGFFGAAAATFGVVLPSFVIIFAVAAVLRQFESIRAVKYAFFGIRAGVLALIIRALLSMYKQCPKSIFSYILMCGSFAAVALFRLNVLSVILICGVCGIAAAALGRDGK